MTTILDTDEPAQCGSCQTMIYPSEAKTVLGYGNLIIVMHPNCWEHESYERIRTVN